MATYSVRQESVEGLLGAVKSGQIAIPELQRPFVWNSTKVRDLLDSLYKGYPVGYLITWQSVGAALKDGQTAQHQQILIDGQQRVTALRAAVVGLPVVDNHYRKQYITIGFNPLTGEFETVTPVIRKTPQWIPDVSELFRATSSFSFITQYLARNPAVDISVVEESIGRLLAIKGAQIGIIALADDLEVETVSEIFIRINSKGVPLSSADFAMSKIATYGDRGRNLRKLIDYFCHLAVAPHVYEDIVENDKEFAETPFLSKISWLRNDAEDLYDPNYGDVIRIANLIGFNRGVASAFVSELSGRDPDTRKVDESRIPAAFDRLEEALVRIVSKFDFQNFIMIIKSAGFISTSLVSSKNALNFAYALYLRLRQDTEISEGERKRIVRRWFVMSMLTGRNSGSVETQWELDIRRVKQYGAAAHLKQIEDAELSDTFWQVTLPGNLETSSVRSPYFQSFLAAQVKNGSRGFLSKSITVQAMHEQIGDIHHIVPKDYLKRAGITDRSDYNQVANYVLTETSINIRISNRPPGAYLQEVQAQIESGLLTLGEITEVADLRRNFEENAIPEDLDTVLAGSYQDFLTRRRRLMARKIQEFYESL